MSRDGVPLCTYGKKHISLKEIRNRKELYEGEQRAHKSGVGIYKQTLLKKRSALNFGEAKENEGTRGSRLGNVALGGSRRS